MLLDLTGILHNRKQEDIKREHYNIPESKVINYDSLSDNFQRLSSAMNVCHVFVDTTDLNDQQKKHLEEVAKESKELEKEIIDIHYQISYYHIQDTSYHRPSEYKLKKYNLHFPNKQGTYEEACEEYEKMKALKEELINELSNIKRYVESKAITATTSYQIKRKQDKQEIAQEPQEIKEPVETQEVIILSEETKNPQIAEIEDYQIEEPEIAEQEDDASLKSGYLVSELDKIMSNLETKSEQVPIQTIKQSSKNPNNTEKLNETPISNNEAKNQATEEHEDKTVYEDTKPSKTTETKDNIIHEKKTDKPFVERIISKITNAIQLIKEIIKTVIDVIKRFKENSK